MMMGLCEVSQEEGRGRGRWMRANKKGVSPSPQPPPFGHPPSPPSCHEGRAGGCGRAREGGAGRHRAGVNSTLGGVTQACPCCPGGGARMDGEDEDGYRKPTSNVTGSDCNPAETLNRRGWDMVRKNSFPGWGHAKFRKLLNTVKLLERSGRAKRAAYTVLSAVECSWIM